jgi:hypothetical protein
MPNDSKKAEHRIKAIDSGAAIKKGVSELREGQKPAKPAGLIRPKGVFVSAVPAKTDGASNQKK